MEEYICVSCCAASAMKCLPPFLICKPSLMFDFAVTTLHEVTDQNLQLKPKSILFSRSHRNSWHGRRNGKLGTSDVSWVCCTLWLEHRKRSWQETGDDDCRSRACPPSKVKVDVNAISSSVLPSMSPSNICRVHYLQIFWMFNFRTLFLSFRTTISDTLVKCNLSKSTPTKHELDRCKICEIDGFTAAARSYEYTNEKITQVLSSLCVCLAVSQLESAP